VYVGGRFNKFQTLRYNEKGQKTLKNNDQLNEREAKKSTIQFLNFAIRKTNTHTPNFEIASSNQFPHSDCIEISILYV